MRLNAHVFSETRVNGMWVADAAKTFTMKSLTTLEHSEACMEQVALPKDPMLYGLLSDEVWESLPWSFWQKGMPHNASTQVVACHQSWEKEAFGHNWVTLQELVDKYVELLLDQRPQAQRLKSMVSDLVYLMYAGEPKDLDPEDRRIVFWFH